MTMPMFNDPIQHPKKYSAQHESTKKKYLGDRFIPTRTLNQEDALDWPTKQSFNQLSPFAKLLTCSLLDTTPEAFQTRTVLSYASPADNHKPFTQNSLNTFFSKHSDQRTHVKPSKKISIKPTQVLDAPSVLPDFYSNVFTWSGTNLISIALGNRGQNGQIYNMNLSDKSIGSSAEVYQQQAYAVATLGQDEIISGWSDGTIRTHALDSHALAAPYSRANNISSSTIHAIATFSASTLVCGDGQGKLHHMDLRLPPAASITHVNNELEQPTQISGLAYNDHFYFASGENSNTVKLWDIRQLAGDAVSTYAVHDAAVKALAFKPGSGDYLVTGGGTACRKLCLWHVPTGQKKDMVDTLAQVTGVHWFKHDPRYLLTSHGFSDCSVKLWRVTNNKLSLEKQIKVSDTQNDRALCLAGSPTTNEFAVVTESETLRFFKSDGINAQETKASSTGSSPPQMLGFKNGAFPRL